MNDSGQESETIPETSWEAAEGVRPGEIKRPFIPAWLDDAGLPPSEFRLYCHLCRRADNKTGIAWPSYEAMMEACGFSRKTVWRMLRNLERRGLVSRLGKGFKESCRYQILANSVTSGTVENAPTVSQGERLSPNGVTSGTNREPQSFPSCNINRSPDDAPIVSPGEREGNPMKVIQ